MVLTEGNDTTQEEVGTLPWLRWEHLWGGGRWASVKRSAVGQILIDHPELCVFTAPKGIRGMVTIVG